MDWAEVARELGNAAHIYKVFEAGAEAAQEIVNAEHRLLNFQAAIPRAEAKLMETQREETLIQGAIQEAKNQLTQLTQRVAQLGPQVATAEASLKRLHIESQRMTDEIQNALKLESTRREEDIQRHRQAETDLGRIQEDVRKLQGIRDAFKAQLAQV